MSFFVRKGMLDEKSRMVLPRRSLAAHYRGSCSERCIGACSWMERSPTRLERWIARRAAVPPGAKSEKNPVSKTDEVLADARAHWADHCASCHANDGSGDTPMGKHMYPQAPDMRQVDTQSLTDGKLFYIIQNGVRLTGMPGMPAWAAVPIMMRRIPGSSCISSGICRA
jgi:hypothetical protein